MTDSDVIEQARQQTVKAGRYYARVLAEAGAQTIVVRVSGVTMVVAHGEKGDKLAKWAKRQGLQVQSGDNYAAANM